MPPNLPLMHNFRGRVISSPMLLASIRYDPFTRHVVAMTDFGIFHLMCLGGTVACWEPQIVTMLWARLLLSTNCER